MTKFHINKHGVPAPCKATKGKCPLGGASGGEKHFDNIEDAQEYADKENEQKHGIIAGIKPELTDDNFMKSADGVDLVEGEHVFKYEGEHDDIGFFHDRTEALEYVHDMLYDSSITAEQASNKLEKLKVTEDMVNDYQNEKRALHKNITEGEYQGNEYKTSASTRSSLLTSMNEGNVKKVLDSAFMNRDFPLNYHTESSSNTPVEMDVEVSMVEDDWVARYKLKDKYVEVDEYVVTGSMKEYSMVEDDFDTREHFDEYIDSGPDMSYDVSYKFKSGELRDTMIKNKRLGKEGTELYDTQGAIFSGIYDMSRDRV